jgi:hypothetical protein
MVYYISERELWVGAWSSRDDDAHVAKKKPALEPAKKKQSRKK